MIECALVALLAAPPVLSDEVSLAKVAPPADASSLAPNVAAGPDGVYLSWLEVTPKGNALKLARWSGTQWSAAKTIASGRRIVVNEADPPALAALSDGSLVLQWAQSSETDPDSVTLFVARSPDGGKTWEKPVALSRDGEQERGFVSFLEAGGALSAAWLESPRAKDAETRLVVAPWSAKGAGEPVVVDARVCANCQPAAVATDAGVLVVYRDRGTAEGRDVSWVLLEKGNEAAGWPKSKQVSLDGWKSCPVNGPAAAAAGKSVAIAWYTAADQEPKVKVALSSDGGKTFAAPVRVDRSRPAGRVDVEWLPGGWALVSWVERVDGEASRLVACWVQSNGEIGEPIEISKLTGGSADVYPRMARKGGEVFFTWTQGGADPTIEVVRMRGLNQSSPRIVAIRREGPKAIAKAKAPPAGLNQPAKDFSAVSIRGDNIRLADFKGKVVLLTFFGTWCPPCRAEIPEVVALRQRLHGNGFEVIAVNAGDDKSTVTSFAEKQGMKYPIVQDKGQTDLFGVTGYPTNIVIDKTGTVRYRSSGYSPQSMSQMSGLIEKLLE